MMFIQLLSAFPRFFSKLKCQILFLGKWALEMQKCPYRDSAFLSSLSFSTSICLIFLLARSSDPLHTVGRSRVTGRSFEPVPTSGIQRRQTTWPAVPGHSVGTSVAYGTLLSLDSMKDFVRRLPCRSRAR